MWGENMHDNLDCFLIDICTGSVLTYEQSTQLWTVLGNKRRMWQAAEDANTLGYSAVFELAVSGRYQDQGENV